MISKEECSENCSAYSTVSDGGWFVGVVCPQDCTYCGFSKTENLRRRELINKNGLSKKRSDINGNLVSYLLITKP